MMMVAWVQTLVLTRLPSACCFPDLFQSMYMQNAFHLCLHSRRIELASTGHLLRGHVAIITKLSPHYILTESNHFQSVMQFDPRSSPDFSPQLRDKIWEWPGDEGIEYKRLCGSPGRRCGLHPCTQLWVPQWQLQLEDCLHLHL